MKKDLSSFEVALNTGSQLCRRFRCSQQQRYDLAVVFLVNFQMSTIHWNDFHRSHSVISKFRRHAKVDPRYGVKFNVLITSMQVGAICQLVKPYLPTGRRWVPKAAVYMRWILQCVGWWQWPAECFNRDVVNLFLGLKATRNCMACQPTLKDFCHFAIAVNLICRCFAHCCLFGDCKCKDERTMLAPS